MQSISSRIWTRVAVSISYDDNHYTSGTSIITITPRAPPYAYYVHVMIYHRCSQLRYCPILFKVLALNVPICIVRLHFSNFCLSSVADFSNTEVRVPTKAGRTLFLPAWRVMRFGQVVWVWIMVIFWWLFLFSSIEATFIDEQQ